MRALLLLILFLVGYWFIRRLWRALSSGFSADRPEVHRRGKRRGDDEIEGGRIIDVPFTEHRENEKGEEGKKGVIGDSGCKLGPVFPQEVVYCSGADA